MTTTTESIAAAVAESSTTNRIVDLEVAVVETAIFTLSLEHGLEDSAALQDGVTEAWGTDDDGSEWRLAIRETPVTSTDWDTAPSTSATVFVSDGQVGYWGSTDSTDADEVRATFLATAEYKSPAPTLDITFRRTSPEASCFERC